jgi:lipopolysaccharide/colanic/teichoic acid biosynthesis glycosyltransferase
LKIEIQLGIKRLTDIFLAVVSVILGLPLFAAIAMLVRLESLGPVIFCQWRSGRNGVSFRMYKFRTMYDGAPHLRNPDGSAFIERNDSRVTRTGRWLREFSLDEIPQLFNVLRGDMSLVGPRPEKPDYTEELPDWALDKLRFRPGCLSLTLIHGRNELSWVARNELDIVYVQTFSLVLDAKILVLGLWTMFVDRKGLYSPARPAAPATLDPHEIETDAIEHRQTAGKEQIS